MSHNIPLISVQKHTKSISDAKRTQVSDLQNHIQEILGDTHHTFLQGSYKNDTSTSDIKDVDIVAVRLTTYSSVHSSIKFLGTIPWDSIFTEIEQKLRDQRLYQWAVTRRDKCIEVKTGNFKADIVPAVQINADPATDPIAIYSFSTGIEKINSPRAHYENGVKKHQGTKGNYKPIVRMYKNWAVNHFNEANIVSSYHVESLVHTVPDEYFSNDHALTFLKVGGYINALLTRRDVLPFRIVSVCGTEDITISWDFSSRQRFNSTLKASLLHGRAAIESNTIQEAERSWNRAFNL